MDDFWDKAADNLENALLENVQALVLHFLRTATPEAFTKIAGDLLSEDGSKMREGVVQTLMKRLEKAPALDGHICPDTV